MLRHELVQHLILLLFVARRLPLPLHLLVVHHFLDHATRLAVQFGQLAVLRLNLRGVDFGRGCHDVRPPVRARRFGEGDVNGFGVVLGVCGQGPG